MTQFQYRFAAILQLRRRQRDDVRLDIATCLAEVDSIDAQISSLEKQVAELIQNPNLHRVGRISLETLQHTNHQSAFLRHQLSQLQSRRIEQETCLSELQDQLRAAQLEVARYEKLESSDEAKFRQDQRRIAHRHETAPPRQSRGLGTSNRSTTI